MFGDRIRELRYQHEMTQRELAKRVGRGFSYISKFENNRLEHAPSIRTIQRLAEVLDLDKIELMKLANIVTSLLEPITADKNARRFFRCAIKTITSSEGW